MANEQDVVINDGTIDALGKSKKDYASLNELPFTEKTILKYVSRFILKAIATLKKKKLIDTGELSSSIIQGDLINDSGKYSIQIGYPEDSAGAKYYDYVNKGVTGYQSKTPISEYKFKDKDPSTNGPMVKAIQKWVERKGLQARTETKRTSTKPLQQKRLSLSKITPSRQVAWLIARSIKRKGIERSGFIDDSIASAFGKEFLDSMGKAVGGDVRVYIRQAIQLSK